MAKPISAVPQIFATASSPLPLANLDSDFAYVVTKLNDLTTYNNYVADSGSLNSLVLNYPTGVVLAGLVVGLQVQFKPANTNTGAVTLQVQVNGVNVGSAASVVDAQGSALSASTLQNTVVYSAVYDGTKWFLVGVQNPSTTNLGLAQTIVTSDYTIVLSDANKQLFQPSSDTTLRSVQIPTNASVPFPIGTTFTFITDQSAGGFEVYTFDYLYVANTTIVDLFHLGAKSMATAVKVTSTKWAVNGVGVTA